MGFSAFDSLEQWVKRIHGPDSRRLRLEQPLRALLLRRLLIAVSAATLLYLVLGYSGLARSRVFPWDALELAAVILVCVWLERRGSTSSAATLLIAVVTHPISFLVAVHGIESPTSALFVVTILACGLLVGRYLVPVWTGVCCGILLFVAIVASDAGASRPLTDDVPALLFWWGVFAASGWLVCLFSRHLERLLESNNKAEEEMRSAIVEERTRFAREVHDTLAQGFTGIVMQLNAADEVLDQKPDLVRKHLERARSLARSSLDEARRSALALRHGALSGGSLTAALRLVALRITEGTGVRVDFELDDGDCDIPPDADIHLVRICEEAVTNAVRHARPAGIVVRWRCEPAQVRLEILDDGSGMPESGPANARGLGLLGMRERAEKLGGQIRFTSRQTGGTAVEVCVPVRQ